MSLVIDEAYIGGFQNHLASHCHEINVIINEYSKIMNEVITAGIVEGETAEALKVFVGEVKSKAEADSVNPQAMVSHIERLCSNYISRIDEADRDLY